MTQEAWTEAMDGSPATIPLQTANPLGDPSIGEAGYIKFQAGPIKEFGHNGTTIEAVIQVLIDRLGGFQRGPFACPENAQAIAGLHDALMWLQQRTNRRQEQGVEGKTIPHKS